MREITVYIKDYYSSKMSDKNFLSYYTTYEKEHTLTGGTFIALSDTLIFGRYFKVPEMFSDKCTCPLPIKDRCSVILPIVSFNN